MTKNLLSSSSSSSPKPPLKDELDLDSFLRRHHHHTISTSTSPSDSDSDSENLTSTAPHRTVDDILNDSDSSDHETDSVISVRNSTPLNLTSTSNSTSKTLNSTQLKYSLIQRFKSDEFSSRKPPAAPNSRGSSVFGGGVRSAAAAKPGAALAAAAAASRSVKSRRALSLSLSGKVSDVDDLYDFSERVSSASSGIDVKLESSDVDFGNRNDDNRSDDNVGAEISNNIVGEEISSDVRGGGGAEVRILETRSVSSNEELSTVDLSVGKGNVDGERGDERSGILETRNEGEIGEEMKVRSALEDVGTSDEIDGRREEESVVSELEDVGGKEGSVVSELVNVDETSSEGLMDEKETQTMQPGSEEKVELVSNEVGTVGGDGLSSDSDEVRELVEELVEDSKGQLESDGESREAEEKLRPKKKPLELAEELEKKQASSGQDWEEGAAAQPMKLEGLHRESTVLGYFDVSADNAISRAIKSQTFRQKYGNPQVVAVNLNYIALGMSKGLIVVVPSKYSPQNSDSFDTKMLMLGTQGDRSLAPVTSLNFNQQGDLLLSGYGDGRITIWNLPKGTVAKVVTGEHKAPVVHAFFLGQFKVVTGDCKGLLKLHEISVSQIFGYTFKCLRCLSDGQNTGTVLSASPLLPDEFAGAASATLPGNTAVSTSSKSGMMGGVVGSAGWKLFAEGSSMTEEGVVVFVSHQNAVVLSLSPNFEVYAKLAKPDGVREGAMPYTAWKCTTQLRGSSSDNIHPEALEKISLLGIAWDRKVQVAKLVKSKVEVCAKWTLESAATGLAWLNDQMLVILTMAGQLCLFTKDGTLIHQTSYGINVSGGDDLIAYHTYFTNVFGNPEKAYHKSLAVRGASFYIISPTDLVISRLLLWRERIQVLSDAGDWMGAFNMAMTLYDGQTHGVIDLPRDLHALQDAIRPFLVELLYSYVKKGFSYISVAFSNQIGKSEQEDGTMSTSNSADYKIKEQYTHIGGVAVEFCIHIKRTDYFFDKIYSEFEAAKQKDTFLELLEPYILKDMLGSLPPQIMQELVEHYNEKGWLQRVEQCILHMDISSLDFNQVIKLCRENGLHGALIYLFSKGLDDYRTPLEELLSVLRNHERDFATVGYRMLVYLKHCFSGLAFPPGHGTIPCKRVCSLRTELVQYLLEDSSGPKSVTGVRLTSTGAYLNLYYLLELDTEATLDVLRVAFMEDENLMSANSPDGTIGDCKDIESITEDENELVQKTVDALVLVLDVEISQIVRSAGNDDTGMEVWPSKKDIGHLIEFIAGYVASKHAYVSKSVLSQILEYLMSENYYMPNDSADMNDFKKGREKKVLALLDAVPQTEWDASYVLHLCEKAHFYQVCGLIYTMRRDYVAALHSYLKDVDEPVHAFSFIDCLLLELSENEGNALRSEVFSQISKLVTLSRECTFFLVSCHFSNENRRIVSELHSTPRSLFLYLKTLVEVHLSGTLKSTRISMDSVRDGPWGRLIKNGKNHVQAYLERMSEFPKFVRDNPVEVTDDLIELYLKMLCQYEPDSVLKFLETFEHYRVDRCLQLCQEYGIVDAAAYLLERVGDVGSALVLILSSVNDQFIMLDTAVGNLVSDMNGGLHASEDYFAAASEMKEVRVIRNTLHACIGLCQRNTSRLESDESESLWFHLLDSFCKPLVVSQGRFDTGMIVHSSSSRDGPEHNDITWRVSSTCKYAPLLKKLFSQFVKEIVEGMIGFVRLPSIMSKLLSDNGSQEFGDFKLTILGMLGTYGFEKRILDTAKCLIEEDAFSTMNSLKKGATKGYAPRSLLCCICNCSFGKNSSSSGIRVFSCGHATHLHCELQESGTSTLSSASGCPLCVIKKKTDKAKGKVVEQGLVSTSPYRSFRAQGTNNVQSHEFDSFENSGGPNQISRFDVLNGLARNQRSIYTDTMPQLRLAPPAIYHDKVNRKPFSSGGSGRGLIEPEKPGKSRQLRNVKVKGSSSRFPLSSRIFGKEKTRSQ